MRPLLLLLALAACAPASSDDAPGPDSTAAPPTAPAAATADDLAARAAAAGLTLDQAQTLTAYGAGAAVPTLPAGWTLTEMVDETVTDGPVPWPGYTLRYRRTDGACFTLMAASEGLGDAFVIAPPHDGEAAATGIAVFGPVPLGWSEPDEPGGDWGPGRLSTEWFGADGLFFLLNSATEDGCTMVTPDEARALLAGLRYLDPADDDTLPGLWAPMETMEEGGDPAALRGPDPEAMARTTFPSDARTTRVETLRPGADRRILLVTHEGLMDDSVQDERIRVVYVRDGFDGLWGPQYVGRQHRCRSGRGHEGWGVENCI